MHEIMRLWHSDYDGKRIRFRPSPSAEGWFRGVEPADDGWIMTAESDGKHYRMKCSLLKTSDFPEWYEEMLEKNLRKMSEVEVENSGA